MDTNSPDAGSVIFGGLAVLGLIALYFAPALVATKRKHHNHPAILALNLFLGWTVIGWVAALVWALTMPAPSPPVAVAAAPVPSSAPEDTEPRAPLSPGVKIAVGVVGFVAIVILASIAAKHESRAPGAGTQPGMPLQASGGGEPPKLPAAPTNPDLALAPKQLFGAAHDLARRMAAGNRPHPVVDGKPLVTKTEVSQMEDALRQVTGAEARTAKRLSALIGRLGQEGEKAFDREVALAGAQRRKEYASTLENVLLQKGMDAVVTATGPAATVLTVRYIMMNRPMVYQILNGTEFIEQRKQDGFRRAIFTDGYERSWSYDLAK